MPPDTRIMLELFYHQSPSKTRFFINPDDEDISKMIEYLQEKTGLYLDPYANVKLYPSHQKLIVSFLENEPKKHNGFIRFLQEAIKRDTLVYCIGD